MQLRNDTEHTSACFGAASAFTFLAMRYSGGYGERAWVAWHSLSERDNVKGSPVALRELERRHKLNQGELTKFVRGEYAEPSYRVVRAAAEALRITIDWLMHELGDGPARAHYIGAPPDWPGPRKSAKRAPASGKSRIRRISAR